MQNQTYILVYFFLVINHRNNAKLPPPTNAPNIFPYGNKKDVSSIPVKPPEIIPELIPKKLAKFYSN